MQHGIKPIERRKVTDQIIDQLLALVASGRFQTGDRLPSERELMNEFGVGRSSLREAIGALSLIGMLSTSAGRGTYISVNSDKLRSRPLTWRVQMGGEKVEELIEARIVLEEAIVGLAAAKAEVQDVNEIKERLQFLKSVVENRRRAAQVEADLSLHLSLATAAHNATLNRFLSELLNLMRLWMKQTVRDASPERDKITLGHHSGIVEAIEARDVERARETMRKHLEFSANNLSSILLGKQLVSTSV